MVGISWYLWIFVIIFLLLNISGRYTLFWIGLVPFTLLIAVGTKLEHVISQLAHEIAEKHIAIEGELVVRPSDDHFWFNQPRLVLFLIHVQYGFNSCIIGKVRFMVPRLVIGVFIQVLCSYSTLPLYAIVTQMGSSFKKSIFEEHVQVGLVGWAQKVKNKTQLKAAAGGSAHSAVSNNGSSATAGIQLGSVSVGTAGIEEVPPKTTF